jgi:hypothetical protein
MPNDIWGRVKIISCSLCNFLHSPVCSSLLDPDILLRTLVSNTLSICSSVDVRDQVSHPCKIAGRIMRSVLMISSHQLPVFQIYLYVRCPRENSVCPSCLILGYAHFIVALLLFSIVITLVYDKCMHITKFHYNNIENCSLT